MASEWLGPGISEAAETAETELGWSEAALKAEIRGGILLSTAADAGNTSLTTTLRMGLVMAQVDASGKWAQWDPTATDGTAVARGVLPATINTLNTFGTAADKWVSIMIGGPVRASRLLVGGGATFTSIARRQMHKFLFDDDMIGANQNGDRYVTVVKTADYTVVAADVGKRFVTTAAAGAVNFTLPAIANVTTGWFAEFLNTVDQNMTVTAPANKLIAVNNLTATSVAFSTANLKIGGMFRITYDNILGKYIAQTLSAGANTVTVA